MQPIPASNTAPSRTASPATPRQGRWPAPLLRFCLFILFLSAFAGIAWAQDPVDIPGSAAATDSKAGDARRTPLPAPNPNTLPARAPTPAPEIRMPNGPTNVTFRALLTEDGQPVGSGLVWRVFSGSVDGSGKLQLVANAAGGEATFELAPGSYFVHVAFGAAGATKQIVVNRVNQTETLVLNAGGIRLHGAISENQPIDPDKLSYEIYSGEPDEERRLLVPNAREGHIVRLNAGIYHIVSKYGGVNAVVRADIKVEAGKLTDATIFHRAADVTLKLVNEPGGEALANTAWVVLSPGGDVVTERVGAFPRFVLAAGEYSVIARHEGKTYNRDFNVEPGRDGDVEVVATPENLAR